MRWLASNRSPEHKGTDFAGILDPGRDRLRTGLRKLDKSLWQAYFDVMSKAPVGKSAAMEVALLKLGDQLEAEWAPLLGITYDPKDDGIELALEGHDHLINKPREVYVEDQELEPASLEVGALRRKHPLN